ncbi:MAG: hypothetical protein WDZ72_14540, partial [Cyclobacteriaceae bacterium]
MHGNYSVIPKILTIVSFLSACTDNQTTLREGLAGHWDFKGNALDLSDLENHAQVHGDINFEASGPNGQNNTAAEFSGKEAWLEVPVDQSPQLGNEDFTISAWVYLEEDGTGVSGDLISQYDS